MSTLLPIPRDIRRQDLVAAAGQTAFAAAGFVVFDPQDVRVRVKAAASPNFVTVTDGVTVTLAGSAPANPLVTFASGRAVGDVVRIEGSRLPSRTTDVTFGGVVRSASLEAEFDRVTVTGQELWRDIGNVMGSVDAIDAAVAATAVDRDATAEDRAAAHASAIAAAESAQLAEETVMDKADVDFGNVDPATGRTALDVVATGAIPDVAFTPKSPIVQRSIRDRALDAPRSLLDFISDKAIRDAIIAGTNTTSLHSYISDALTFGYPIMLPPHDILVKDQITMPIFSKLIGAANWRSILVVPSDFNMTKTSVVKMNHYCTLYDFAVACSQTAARASGLRSDLVQYPWLIDMQSTSHCTASWLRLMEGYKGINGGDSGGSYLSHLKVGCFHTGLSYDDAHHIVNLHSYDYWPYFRTSSTNLSNIWADGTGLAFDCGRVDGLMCTAYTVFKGKTIFRNKGTGVTFGAITNSNFDLNGAGLEIQGGDLKFSDMNSSASDLTGILKVSGGHVTVSGGIWGMGTVSGGKPMVEVTGGVLLMDNIEFRPGAADAQVYKQTGGRAYIDSSFITAIINTNRPNPMIDVSGGVFRLSNTAPEPMGTGSGTFVRITAESSQHAVDVEGAGLWDVALPGSVLVGAYRTPWLDFTPSVSFQTNGDFAPTYATRTGRYRIDGRSMDVVISLIFNTNAYTTASGLLQITGLPCQAGRRAAGMLSACANIDFGTSGISIPTCGANTTTLVVRRFNNGGAETQWGTANIPPSRSGIALDITIRVPLS